MAGLSGQQRDPRQTYEELWPYMLAVGGSADEHGRKPAKYGDDVYVLCPRHPDGTKTGRRSLHLAKPTSRVGLHCFAGCTNTKEGFLAVLDAITGGRRRERPVQPTAIGQYRKGAAVAALAAARPVTPGPEFVAAQQRKIVRLPGNPDAGKNATGKYELVRQYEYRKPDGTLVAVKGRFQDGPLKTFKWRHPADVRWNDNGESYVAEPVWRGLAEGELRNMPLWGVEDVAGWDPAEPIWFCEGEKDTEACREKGLHALCHGGGAHTIDFGDSLDPLAGRPVILWPDNDAQGRSYMQTVHARLRRVGAKVSIVVLPRNLDEKEGAADYFNPNPSTGRKPGTLEELKRGVLLEDSVTYAGLDQIVVQLLPMPKPKPRRRGAEEESPLEYYATPEYPVEFTFNEIDKATRELAAEMTVRLMGIEDTELEYVQRINVLSHSAFEDVGRTLESIYGAFGMYGWALMLNKAITKARRAYLRRDRSRDVFDIEVVNTELFLIDEILPYRQSCIIFGDGMSTKSYSAFRAGLGVAFGMPFAGYETRMQGPILVADWETDETNFRRRIERLHGGIGMPVYPDLVHYWPGLGASLNDMIEGLRRKIVDDGIVLLIVDSAGYACAGEPEKAETAIRFFNALAKLPVTTLMVAHIVKGKEEDQGHKAKPFGSNYWHLGARRTWYVERDPYAMDVNDFSVGFTCRKVNDGPMPPPFSTHVTFSGRDGPVAIEPYTGQRSRFEVEAGQSLVAMVSQTLGPETMAADEIAEILQQNVTTISKLLERFDGMFESVGEGRNRRWRKLGA